jgi:hypothetical protein
MGNKGIGELCAVCSMGAMCAALYAGCCLSFVNTYIHADRQETAYYFFHTAHTYASAVHWPL